jgi:two-component system, cell cycle sensor histidine kinase and response regulator CckA
MSGTEPEGEAEVLRARVLELEAELARVRDQTSLLAAALEQLPASVELLDERGHITYVNRAFERMTGHTSAEAVGRLPSEVLGLATLAPLPVDEMAAALALGQSWTGLLAARMRGGEVKSLETSLSPVQLSGDERRRFVVLRSDVTEQQHEAKRLRESNELYLQLFRNNSAIKLLIDPRSGLIVDANPAAAEFYGYAEAELRGMPISALNALPMGNINEGMRLASAEQQTYFRFPHRLRSGEERRVDVFSGPLEVGGQRLLLSIIQDVTDRERAEAALTRSEARFRTLIEHVPVALAVHREGRFVYVNPALLALLGHERPADLLGRPVTDVVHPGDRYTVVQRIRSMSENGEAVPLVEERLFRRDGSHVVAEVVALPLLFDGLPSVVVVADDVTERRELEEQLRRSHRMEAVGRLAGGVAHDFNNLLFVILNAALFLKRRLPEGSSSLHDAEQIQAAAQRAANLTKQLLLFSRGAEPVAEVLDVNGVVLDLRELLERTLGELIELRILVSPSSCRVKVARGNLEQVLVNLAVNARDAMPEGGTLGIETSAVTLDAQQARGLLGLAPGPHVRVVVRDTGVGMTAEVAAHAFEPFFTTKEQATGTGLGLAITYGIVQKAGGHIAIDSIEGRGTRVTIHLPCAATPAPALEVQSRPEVEPAGRGETILVVEDEAGVRHVLDRILRDNGYEVLLASGPGEALLTAEQHRGTIALLLTDVIMPRMSGPELAERLLKVRDNMRVLYMSGYAGDALERAGVEDGEVHLLPKPFSEPELLARVRELLSGQ